jgi:hypothetical protein
VVGDPVAFGDERDGLVLDVGERRFATARLHLLPGAGEVGLHRVRVVAVGVEARRGSRDVTRVERVDEPQDERLVLLRGAHGAQSGPGG